MNYWKVIKNTVKEFIADDPMSYSSSIAFYTIFSLPAILIITVSIASSAYEDEVVRNNLMEQIQSLFGATSAEEIDKILANADGLGDSVIAKIIGIGTLIFSATTVFVSLQNGLNRIWRIKPKPEKGFIKFIVNRLLSLAMIISIGFLLLVSLVVDTLIVVFNNILSELFSGGTYYIVSAVNLGFSLAIITLVFAMIFKILPDAKVEWRDVWVGAFVTTVLFTLGKYLIGFYLGNSSLSNAYGAAGSLVLLLVWVYYSSVIVLFGAEFTFVYSKEIGHKIRPDKGAVIVRQVESEEGNVNE
ncbi:YihY/virulence factor BrkB family protein [Fulvivirga sp. 2943]|uniref:YihY/virulence factor BrkB family protein n=2 Tax=Fulvivirga sediminis TaxID=2803949 RepID=A0A937F6Y7_9BACT|nr:YihY/virulence factor BrkB family protein [Fulvivirga sediminis]MBL3657572.1 YihY/virulence factor BrkB family protein [Fulvivirga sediminis]